MDADAIGSLTGRWIPITEAAAALELTITAVMDLVRSNRLQAEQQGQHLMISRMSLWDFCDEPY